MPESAIFVHRPDRDEFVDDPLYSLGIAHTTWSTYKNKYVSKIVRKWVSDSSGIELVRDSDYVMLPGRMIMARSGFYYTLSGSATHQGVRL